MILPENPSAAELDAAVGLIRVKIKAGLIEHPDWPPSPSLRPEHAALRLDRIARDVLEQLRQSRV